MIHIEFGNIYDADKPTVLYQNLFADGAISGDEAVGFPVENAASEATGEYWKPPSGAEASLNTTLASQVDADCLFIDAHELGSVGADFRLRVSTDGGATFTTVVDWMTPTDNSPIMVLFPKITGNYWQLQQRNGPAAIGVVMIGAKMAFQYGVEDMVSFRHGRKIEVMGGNSLGGQFIGNKIRRKGGNTSLSFPYLEADWVNDVMADFEAHYDEGKPFAMALGPKFDPSEVAYCWRPDRAPELRPQYLNLGRALSMGMQVDYYVGT